MRDPSDPWMDERALATPVPAIGPTQAELRAQAIQACELCDPDGYRGTQVCDHTDHTSAAARGMARLRTQMGWDTTQPEEQP